MNLHFSRADVKILDQQHVYQGHFQLERLRLQYRLFDGGWSKPHCREVFERGTAVGVLLFDPQRDQIVLIEQFRAGVVLKTENPWLIEIVAGVRDGNEDPKDVAKRETREETGLTVHNLSLISQYWVSPGASTEYMTLYCGQIDASQAQGIHGLAHEGEDIRLHVLSLEKAYHLLNEGKIDNAPTLIALLWLQQHADTIKRAWSR